jgi:hypothetical protein
MGDIPAPDAPCIGKAADERPIFLNGPNIVGRTRVVALSLCSCLRFSLGTKLSAQRKLPAAAAPASVPDRGNACTEAFIAKTDPSGNVIFSTFLGGPTNGYASAIAVDSSGSVYVAGSTGGSFPTTATPIGA